MNREQLRDLHKVQDKIERGLKGLDRGAFAVGLELLRKQQQAFGRPPKKREVINQAVNDIIRKSGMKHDPRRHYFELLATCALLGVEPMYNAFKSKPKKRKQ